jgi:large-conductance mechanosensitive channel
MAGSVDSLENRKWSVDRMDSVLQNWIELYESDYEAYSSMVEDSDKTMVRYRNVVWQALAVIIALAVAFIQAKTFPQAYLVDVIIALIFVAAAWTVVLTVIRRVILPRLDKVEESYKAARLTLLDLQNWFQTSTMNVSAVSKAPLDRYFEFVQVAFASICFPVQLSALQMQKDLRVKRPEDNPFKDQSQRLVGTVAKGYLLYKEKRAELRDTDIFPQSVLYMLEPFENRYQEELKASKTSPSLLPASSP